MKGRSYRIHLCMSHWAHKSEVLRKESDTKSDKSQQTLGLVATQDLFALELSLKGTIQRKVGWLVDQKLVRLFLLRYCLLSLTIIAGHQSNHNCNKFQPVTNSSIAPVPINSWSTALAAVNQDPAQVDLQCWSPNDQKYIYPKPVIFIAVNEMHHARYFTTWQAIEPACIYCLGSSFSATPLSNQEWCDMLIGDITYKIPTTGSALAQEHTHHLLGSAINDLDITTSNISPVAAPVLLDDAEAQWMLLQLTEYNYNLWFKLLALDKHVGPANQDEMECQESIWDCLQIRSLLVADPDEARTGIQSDDWHSRLSCLLKLQSLMRDWEGMKPSALLKFQESIQDYVEADVLLEDVVAHFYTDSFFCFFGCAAIVPAWLSWLHLIITSDSLPICWLTYMTVFILPSLFLQFGQLICNIVQTVSTVTG